MKEFCRVSDHGIIIAFPIATACHLEIVETLFGYTLSDDENEFYISLSAGQSGQTAWCVVHTSVDMGLEIRRGQCASNDALLTDELNVAFAELTKDWVSLQNVN